MNINTSHKILLVAFSEEEAQDSFIISNKLAGFTYDYFNPSESVLSRLRILEFAWNNMDIELWNYSASQDSQDELMEEEIPPICFMDASGLIIVSNEPPINFIHQHDGYFYTRDFPILWIAVEKYTRVNHQESAFQSLNLTKVLVKSPDDTAIIREFNHLMVRVNSYLGMRT